MLHTALWAGSTFTRNYPRSTPARLHRIRLVLAVLCCLLVTGCVASSDDSNTGEAESETKASLLPMTIAEWMYPPDISTATGDPTGVAHLSVTPMQPGSNTITVELTDLQGKPLQSAVSDSSAQLSSRAITPESQPETTELTPVQGDESTWRTAEELDFPDQGWYEFVVSLSHQEATIAVSTMYVLLPDPSVYGSEAVILPASDPDAEILFRRSISRQKTWQAGKWRESLGSGADVLVVSEFALTNRSGEPPAFSVNSIYAASFRDKTDGATPSPPREDFSNRITIGDRGWIRRDGDAWSSVQSRPVTTFDERTNIFRGATNFRPGGSDTIDGMDVEIITFYLPPDGGQNEAWFTWWIDPETGDLVRLAMVARMHFMAWNFYAINEPFTIVLPERGRSMPISFGRDRFGLRLANPIPAVGSVPRHMRQLRGCANR